MGLMGLRKVAIGCAVALVALVSVSVGCGSADRQDEGAAHARAYLVEHLKARLGSFEWLPPHYASATELLGNVRFQEGDATAKPLTDVVVVGKVSEVVPGVGFAPRGSGVEGKPFYDGIMVPFGSGEALWQTVHITVNIEEVLTGGVAGDSGTIQVGLAIGNAKTDFDHIRDGLIALGRTVWFLERGRWPGFSYEPSLYNDIESGRLIGDIAADGTIEFPMLEAGPAAQALRGTTLGQLRAGARERVRTVPLRKDGNVWVR